MWASLAHVQLYLLHLSNIYFSHITDTLQQKLATMSPGHHCQLDENGNGKHS